MRVRREHRALRDAHVEVAAGRASRRPSARGSGARSRASAAGRRRRRAAARGPPPSTSVSSSCADAHGAHAAGKRRPCERRERRRRARRRRPRQRVADRDGDVLRAPRGAAASERRGCASVREHAAARSDEERSPPPRRSDEHGPLAAGRRRAACAGTRGRTRTTRTPGSGGEPAGRRSSPSTRSRLRPTSPRERRAHLRAELAACRRDRRASRTAKTDVSRATDVAPPTASDEQREADRASERPRRQRAGERRGSAAARGQRRGARGRPPAGGHAAHFAAAGPFPYSGGSSSGPRNCTSCSSSTPNRSWTRRRASAISATQSADVAPPAFSMKFACRGEIERAADPVALQPALLDQPPGAELAGRILEDAAERPLVRRLRRLALREQLGDRRLDRLRRARARAGSAPAPRPARARAPSGGRTGRAPSAATVRVPSRVDDDRVDQHRRASRARTRRRSCARRRRPCRGSPTRTRSRRARRRARGAGRRRSSRRRPRRASSPSTRAAASSPASLSTSASTPSSCDEQVRAEPDHLDAASSTSRSSRP